MTLLLSKSTAASFNPSPSVLDYKAGCWIPFTPLISRRPPPAHRAKNVDRVCALRIYIYMRSAHMDRDRRIETLLPLRPVEFHILLSLAGGERHGYGIMQDARERGEAVP